jgi:hypothetical protein
MVVLRAKYGASDEVTCSASIAMARENFTLDVKKPGEVHRL